MPRELQNLSEVMAEVGDLTSDFKYSTADGQRILKCTCAPNFEILGVSGAAEPLGGHIGG